MFFFYARTWVYHRRHAFWQLKFLIGRSNYIKVLAGYLICCLTLTLTRKGEAFEIFNRFMSKHVCGLYELIRSNSETNQQKNWKEVENRVKTQLPLRVMSCVQLASKLTSHYKVRN